jgi:sialic acid synthase SpsE
MTTAPASFRLAGLPIGREHPAVVVAEISNNHNGSFDRARRLIDAAKAAGANLVKFQAYTPDELIHLRGDGRAPDPWGAQGWTMRTLYTRAQTPLDWLPALAAHCRAIDMPWFSSVFGPASLAALEALRCPAYKIARLDAQDLPLRRMVHRTGKPYLVSLGDEARLSRDDLDGSTVRALYCPPGYPPPIDQIRLPRFGDCGAGDARPIGLSSHCLDPLLPMVAVARGAKILEYHLQLDDEPSELESTVSLSASQFRRMVDDVRRVEALCQ